MTRITFETFNVPVGAVVRLGRHRRQQGWTCPQLPASAGRLCSCGQGLVPLCLEGPAHVCEVSCQSGGDLVLWTWWQFKEKGWGSMSSTHLISGRFHRRAATTMAEPGENPLQQPESLLEFVTFLDNKLQGQSRAHFSAAANVDHSQKETCKARRR